MKFKTARDFSAIQLLSLFLIAYFLFAGNAFAQTNLVTISGTLLSESDKEPIPFSNVILKAGGDSAFVAGTISKENGQFILSRINPGNYILHSSSIGFKPNAQAIFVGSASEYLNLGNIVLSPSSKTLSEVEVSGGNANFSVKAEKKIYSIENNLSQLGGSALQAVKNLPGITVEDGKIQLRGNDKVAILLDGRQTALTGFGSQAGLENLPASAIEKIEVIQNPSARYDAGGNAGVLNIVLKKNIEEGWKVKAGFTTGLGALWQRRENLPNIRPQYTLTPKLNPSINISWRKKGINTFFQCDNLFTQTLNKNEFVNRVYDDGTLIIQQTKRNRNTNFLTTRAGIDWILDESNTIGFSGLFGSEKILDRGDEPFFQGSTENRYRLWQFLEDELKTTAMGQLNWMHKFKKPGQHLNSSLSYNYHRENEKYFFTNTLPDTIGRDAFRVLSDENVLDFNADYQQPLRYGRLETGGKFRYRNIPTDMLFLPGPHSILDLKAGGWARYTETIPALYANYIIESRKLEAELGLRMEYVNLRYEVNPNHNTYKSDGYHYAQPFPNLRLSWKMNENHKLSVFLNRRVDRPAEGDIRIFPKYDDAEIVKVGNPALKPQFSNTMELAHKASMGRGFFSTAVFHRITDGTITRISSTTPGSKLIYSVSQNINRSFQSGFEIIMSRDFGKSVSINLSGSGYRRQINAFSILNLYPSPAICSSAEEVLFSGNAKANANIKTSGFGEIQVSAIWLAADLIPQGSTRARFTLDIGWKKSVLAGAGDLFLNASNLLNTYLVQKEIKGNGFVYNSKDYAETQVVRIGFNGKF